MDVLISIIISGMAVGYLTEFLASLLDSLISARRIKLLTTLPLSFLAVWMSGISAPIFWVAGPAAAFFSLTALLLLNRPVSIQTVNRR